MDRGKEAGKHRQSQMKQQTDTVYIEAQRGKQTFGYRHRNREGGRTRKRLGWVWGDGGV